MFDLTRWLAPLRWGLLAIAGIVLVVHACAYDFVTDDAYISFVFSRNLAEHGQLAFNLGQPVEGYTNFLWTVILAGGMLVGISPEWSSRVLGVACALGTLWFTFQVVERALDRRTPWSAAPSVLLALSSGFACWSSGGLETQLFTLLVVIALDGLVANRLTRTCVALALAAMTRPEGPLVAAVFGTVYAAPILYRWVRKRPAGGDRREEVIALACFFALWAPWFAWRTWYYGYPFPNTYYVKASGAWASPGMAHEMWSNGLYYLWVWINQTKLIYALPLAVLGLATAKPGTPRFTLAMACALLAIVYLPYTVTVGGDFMGLHRFIMPMFVVAAIAVVLGLEWLAQRFALAAIGAGVALVAGFAITQVALTRESLRFGNFANDHGIDTPAFLIVYTEDRAAIGRAMESCFRADDFSIVGGAGAQPYFGRMRGIDVFGLVSERIAHEEPRSRARAGHTKWGNDRLLADYDPTFVFSCYRIHQGTPWWRFPKTTPLGCAGFWLAKGYEQITMHIPGMREQGEYYTFLAKKARDFQCPGRVY